MEFEYAELRGRVQKWRVICKDDPEVWVDLFPPGARQDVPSGGWRSIVHMDGKKFGFSNAQRVNFQKTKALVKCDDGLYAIVIWNVCVKVTGDSAPLGGWVQSEATSFVSREQQDRVIQALIIGGQMILNGNITKPKRIIIPMEIREELLAGDYISNER